jgi:hypothetical protein
MGVPMDRSNRVFGKLSTVEKVFPTLEEATMEFTEYDFALKKRSGTWKLTWDGGLMACGNQFCRRGGYEIDRHLYDMVRTHATEKDIKINCRGDEGSPKGRKIGRRCQHYIEGKITLTYKPEGETVEAQREEDL